MKNLFKYSFICVLLSIYSCNNKENSVNETEILRKVVTVEISSASGISSKSAETAPNTTGSIDISMEGETEKLLAIKVSQSIIDATNISEEELNELIALTINDVNSPIDNDDSIGDCKDKCNERFTDANGNKISGRGWCKFDCYVEAFLDALKALLKENQKTITELPELETRIQ